MWAILPCESLQKLLAALLAVPDALTLSDACLLNLLVQHCMITTNLACGQHLAHALLAQLLLPEMSSAERLVNLVRPLQSHITCA